MEKRVGFFIQEIIESDLGENKVAFKGYSQRIEDFLNITPFDECSVENFGRSLSRVQNIAKKYNALINPLLRKIVMHDLRYKVANYIASIMCLSSYTYMYTVNRYDEVVVIELKKPIVVTVKEDGLIYVDFKHNKNQYEYETLSVGLRRIFNSYDLASAYAKWHKQYSDNAFIEVLRDDAVAISLLNSSNFRILIDFDSRLKVCEFSPMWDYYLTSKEDVKRFLEEAEENIPLILEKHRNRQEEDSYYKKLGKTVLDNVKDF